MNYRIEWFVFSDCDVSKNERINGQGKARQLLLDMVVATNTKKEKWQHLLGPRVPHSIKTIIPTYICTCFLILLFCSSFLYNLFGYFVIENVKDT